MPHLPLFASPIADSQGQGGGASLSVRVFGSHGRNTMNFDTQTYIALIGAGSVFIVTIGVFAFLLTRKGK